MATSTKVRMARRPHEDGMRAQSSHTSPLTFARYSVPHEKHPEQNEDTILVDQRRGLAAIFDGVGSGPGHVASRLAARVVRHGWREAVGEPPASQEVIAATLNRDELLQSLVLDAHAQICAAGEQLAKRSKGSAHKKTARPGTTAVLAAFHKSASSQRGYTLSYAHVGDSRIYLFRPPGLLQRLTLDDGYLTLKLEEGIISEDDALRIDQATSADQLSEQELDYFEHRNGITQALGSGKPLTVHTASRPIFPGDRVLLCSDGIHDNLTDRELAELLDREARTTVAKRIVLQAIKRSHEESGGPVLRAKLDDMTAVVVTCNF